MVRVAAKSEPKETCVPSSQVRGSEAANVICGGVGRVHSVGNANTPEGGGILHFGFVEEGAGTVGMVVAHA